jgi:hypothetical protein
MPGYLKDANILGSQPAHGEERDGREKPARQEPVEGTGEDRRREPRYPCNDRAELRRLSDGARFPITVLDVSRGGVGVALSASLSPGSQVEILMPREVVIFGEVRHCRRADDGFHAGILIEDVFYSGETGKNHIHDDQLTLYLAGKGLTMREAIEVGQHLRACRLCNTRAQNAE